MVLEQISAVIMKGVDLFGVCLFFTHVRVRGCKKLENLCAKLLHYSYCFQCRQTASSVVFIFSLISENTLQEVSCITSLRPLSNNVSEVKVKF